jgi:hypothetical protein
MTTREIETFDFLTGLEIMERLEGGEALDGAIAGALAVKAAADADPWHLEPKNGGRLLRETYDMVERVARRNRLVVRW